MMDPSDMAKIAADVFSQKIPSPKAPSDKTWEGVIEGSKKHPLRQGTKALSKAASPAVVGGIAGAALGGLAPPRSDYPAAERMRNAFIGAGVGTVGGHLSGKMGRALADQGVPADTYIRELVKKRQDLLRRIEELSLDTVTDAPPTNVIDLPADAARNWVRGKFKEGPDVLPFRSPEKVSSVADTWRGLSPTMKGGLIGGAAGAPTFGLAQYMMDAPLPSGRSREEIAAQSAYDRARNVNEEAGEPGYTARMSEEMLRSAANMAGINREHPLKAALLAALLGGVGSAGTGALAARISAAAR